MRLLKAVAAMIVICSSQSLRAEELRATCFEATTSGDAIINCLKASVAVETAQLRVLREIRNLIGRSLSKSMVTTATNTELATRQLEVIARALQVDGGRAGTNLFVNDLSNIESSIFDCPTGDCAEDAKIAADHICRQLNYASQYSFKFVASEGDPAVNQMLWVVCRP